MDALKLAIVAPYVPPTYIGGGETYIYYLSRELAESGLNISLFTSTMPLDWGEWDWSHLEVHQCASILKAGNTPVMPGLLSRILNNGPFDLIHTAIPSGFACDVSVLAARIRHIPVVITYHCDLTQPRLLSRAYSSVLKHFTFK